MKSKTICDSNSFYALAIGVIQLSSSVGAAELPEIRTPPAPTAPRINGPVIYGVRPDHPFLYHLPVTGDRPMAFSADHLPTGLVLDVKTGNITGTIHKKGGYEVTLNASNAIGTCARNFKIEVGETIALTPPMGWNSWNHYKGQVSQAVTLQNARAIADSGLINHGWTYLNIDDTWQGARGGRFNAIQGNQRFPDFKRMCDEVHALGLKLGIYSTPWTTSYANYIGGSAENAEGTWTKPIVSKKGRINNKTLPWAIGKYSFVTNDVAQWSAWGVDYLKYDWNPIEYPETKAMAEALRHCGRDLVFSLSNQMNITNGPTISRLANSWRTTGDITSNWRSMSRQGFGQDQWRAFAGPGHWNDPDILEIATKEKNQPGLTPDEEYTQMTLWCLDCAPLLLGNDLTEMTPFTLNLLENDEVLAVNQDALGDQAVTVAIRGDAVVYAKTMADGSRAVGLFNLNSNTVAKVTVTWADLKIHGTHAARDLWRQKNLGQFSRQFSMPVAPHSAELVKLAP